MWSKSPHVIGETEYLKFNRTLVFLFFFFNHKSVSARFRGSCLSGNRKGGMHHIIVANFRPKVSLGIFLFGQNLQAWNSKLVAKNIISLLLIYRIPKILNTGWMKDLVLHNNYLLASINPGPPRTSHENLRSVHIVMFTTIKLALLVLNVHRREASEN